MDIITKTTMQAVKLLDAVRAQYKIVLPTGEEFGELKVEKTNGKHRRALEKPYGSITAYLHPLVDNMQVGDVAEIPPGEFTLEKVQSGAANLGIRAWGKGSVTSTINRARGVVEILRVA